MNGYNLIDKQKELLRKLVRYIREEKLREPIAPVSTDQGYFISLGGKGSLEHQGDLVGDLDALCDEDLMSFRYTERGNKLYNIKKAGYDAVDNNFGTPLIQESPAPAQPTKEQPERTRRDFFISYNIADRQWAEWIAWQLEEAEYTTVLQAWDFRPGSNFVLEMQRAAKEAKRTIAVLSPDYLGARSTQPEWAAAFAQDPMGEKGKLVPVRVWECDLTGLLPQIVYIDLVGLDEAAAKDALLTGVHRGRVKPTVPPGFPGAIPRSVPKQPRFPETPSPATITIPSLAIGEWVQWDELALSVTRYETTYTCPGGYGRSAEGAKFVIIQAAARNVSNDIIEVPSLTFRLNGYQSGLGAGHPCRYDKNAFGNACWQWSGKLYPDVMCEGWVLFEVPEKLALEEARVRVSKRKPAGEPDTAEWRLGGE